MEIEQGKAYYWIEKRIVIGMAYSEDLMTLPNEGYKDFINVPSCDPECDHASFGFFEPYTTLFDKVNGLYWKSLEPENIPKEFLTQLLLLGVTTNGS